MDVDDRTSTVIDWEEEFADDEDYLALPIDAQKKLIEFLNRSIEMKVAAVYGSEEPNESEACIDCAANTAVCQAKCCTLMFALTKDEVDAGKVEYNKDHPFFIARDKDDGYCPHLERDTYACKVWDDRPIRCRNYSCEQDEYIWPKGSGIHLVTQ